MVFGFTIPAYSAAVGLVPVRRRVSRKMPGRSGRAAPISLRLKSRHGPKARGTRPGGRRVGAGGMRLLRGVQERGKAAAAAKRPFCGGCFGWWVRSCSALKRAPLFSSLSLCRRRTRLLLTREKIFYGEAPGTPDFWFPRIIRSEGRQTIGGIPALPKPVWKASRPWQAQRAKGTGQGGTESASAYGCLWHSH